MKQNELLNLFTSKDKLRSEMQTPFQLDGCACTTDGWSLIMIPTTEKLRDTTLKVAALVPPPEGEPKSFSVRALRAALDSIPMLEKIDEQDKPCECIGGQCTCSCGNEHECSLCEGTGKISLPAKHTGQLIVQDDRAVCSIDGVGFTQLLLRRLIAVVDFRCVETFSRITPPKDNAGNLFLVGDIRVLLMPNRREAVVSL